MIRRNTLLQFLIPFILVFLLAGTAHSLSLVNTDKETYEYAVYWQDLSPTTKGGIEPGQTVDLSAVKDDSPCLIELVGRRDNIYARQDDTVRIVDGVMSIAPTEK